jgi:RND superfamily putative drug exporter
VFEAVARLVTSYPRSVLAFWFALIVLSLPLSSRVGEVLTTDAGNAPNSEAARVQALIQNEFDTHEGFQLLLVADARSPAVSPEALEQQFYAVLGEIGELGAVSSVRDARSERLLPSFRDTGRASVAFVDLATTDWLEAQAITSAVEAKLPTHGAINYHLTGGPAIEREIQAISHDDARRAEIIGIPISLIVLVLVFGAVVAATLPLIVALTSISLSLAALYLLGQLIPMAAFAQIIVTMLGLATGIDYALLMVNRYREELAKGYGSARAAAITTRTAGKAVTFSGLTVMVALTALLIPPLDFVRSMGLASMTVMFFSVSASLTALPALFTLMGKRVNWLQLTRRVPGMRSRGFWRARALAIMRRPWTWTFLGTALLVVMALPALTMNVGFAGIRGLTQETSARSAQMVLEELGMAGLLHSFDVLIDFGERGFYHPSSVRAASQLTRSVQALEAVEQVLSPTTAGTFPPLLITQYYASPTLAAESPLADLARVTVSQSGRYALLRAFPNEEHMPHQGALLKRELRALAEALELNILIGGDYVSSNEWMRALYSSFPLAVALVYLITFILLALAFHSILIPLKSILLNTLTVGAAFGVITLVFQHGFLASLVGVPGGFGFVETSVPIFIFAIVFGLSMDYEVFLVSRIVEGHQRGMSDPDAVVHALTVTGNVITSAAAIMIIVFSVFLLSNVVLIKTLSLGLTVAVLLDATLVRLALVPAVILLAGRLNWWLPKPMARLAQRVDLSHD